MKNTIIIVTCSFIIMMIMVGSMVVLTSHYLRGNQHNMCTPEQLESYIPLYVNGSGLQIFESTNRKYCKYPKDLL